MFITISCFTQTATPVPQKVNKTVKGAWGETVTLQCPYRPGNYLSAYKIEWSIQSGGNTIIVELMEPFSLSEMDFSLSVELNPFVEGIYQCRVTLLSDSPTGGILPEQGDIDVSIEGMFIILMIYLSIFLIKKFNECCLSCLCNI